jgi:hypothetical protein
LLTKVRTLIHEEISLLTVLYFPFRARTPHTALTRTGARSKGEAAGQVFDRSPHGGRHRRAFSRPMREHAARQLGVRSYGAS